MDIINNFLKAISSSVNGPLTLIAFIVVAFLAGLLFILKHTNGLKEAQKLLFKDASLKQGEFLKLVNIVLRGLLVIATMLFVLLFYDYYTKIDLEKAKLQANIDLQKVRRQNGLVCFSETCNGRDPKESSCDKGVDTITSKIASFPDLGENYKNIKLEIRHSAKCNASWIKSDPVIGATIYFENKKGEKYVPLLIKDDGIKEPHFTDMLSAEIEKRACIEYPNQEPQCTSFITQN
ncbi:DUF2690 domain-containing protein [Pseudanabaena sp. 'Roaring Creek']|uniref:DUF2690 domain-containing protein n=1 Tax=Pseudanabaena sp. 'Roaring Creek' TaxID=1681830 RepID=UPI0006D7752F|nr:DUF2690 domain-containing protein [Pseudanabaena sp. 'Roaring Creek']